MPQLVMTYLVYLWDAKDSNKNPTSTIGTKTNLPSVSNTINKAVNIAEKASHVITMTKGMGLVAATSSIPVIATSYIQKDKTTLMNPYQLLRQKIIDHDTKNNMDIIDVIAADTIWTTNKVEGQTDIIITQLAKSDAVNRNPINTEAIAVISNNRSLFMTYDKIKSLDPQQKIKTLVDRLAHIGSKLSKINFFNQNESSKVLALYLEYTILKNNNFVSEILDDHITSIGQCFTLIHKIYNTTINDFDKSSISKNNTHELSMLHAYMTINNNNQYLKYMMEPGYQKVYFDYKMNKNLTYLSMSYLEQNYNFIFKEIIARHSNTIKGLETSIHNNKKRAQWNTQSINIIRKHLQGKNQDRFMTIVDDIDKFRSDVDNQNKEYDLKINKLLEELKTSKDSTKQTEVINNIYYVIQEEKQKTVSPSNVDALKTRIASLDASIQEIINDDNKINTTVDIYTQSHISDYEKQIEDIEKRISTNRDHIQHLYTEGKKIINENDKQHELVNQRIRLVVEHAAKANKISEEGQSNKSERKLQEAYKTGEESNKDIIQQDFEKLNNKGKEESNRTKISQIEQNQTKISQIEQNHTSLQKEKNQILKKLLALRDSEEVNNKKIKCVTEKAQSAMDSIKLLRIQHDNLEGLITTSNDNNHSISTELDNLYKELNDKVKTISKELKELKKQSLTDAQENLALISKNQKMLNCNQDIIYHDIKLWQNNYADLAERINTPEEKNEINQVNQTATNTLASQNIMEINKLQDKITNLKIFVNEKLNSLSTQQNNPNYDNEISKLQKDVTDLKKDHITEYHISEVKNEFNNAINSTRVLVQHNTKEIEKLKTQNDIISQSQKKAITKSMDKNLKIIKRVLDYGNRLALIYKKNNNKKLLNPDEELFFRKSWKINWAFGQDKDLLESNSEILYNELLPLLKEINTSLRMKLNNGESNISTDSINFLHNMYNRIQSVVEFADLVQNRLMNSGKIVYTDTKEVIDPNSSQDQNTRVNTMRNILITLKKKVLTITSKIPNDPESFTKKIDTVKMERNLQLIKEMTSANNSKIAKLQELRSKDTSKDINPEQMKAIQEQLEALKSKGTSKDINPEQMKAIQEQLEELKSKDTSKDINPEQIQLIEKKFAQQIENMNQQFTNALNEAKLNSGETTSTMQEEVNDNILINLSNQVELDPSIFSGINWQEIMPAAAIVSNNGIDIKPQVSDYSLGVDEGGETTSNGNIQIIPLKSGIQEPLDLDGITPQNTRLIDSELTAAISKMKTHILGKNDHQFTTIMNGAVGTGKTYSVKVLLSTIKANQDLKINYITIDPVQFYRKFSKVVTNQVDALVSENKDLKFVQRDKQVLRNMIYAKIMEKVIDCIDNLHNKQKSKDSIMKSVVLVDDANHNMASIVMLVSKKNRSHLQIVLTTNENIALVNGQKFSVNGCKYPFPCNGNEDKFEIYNVYGIATKERLNNKIDHAGKKFLELINPTAVKTRTNEMLEAKSNEITKLLECYSQTGFTDSVISQQFMLSANYLNAVTNYSDINLTHGSKFQAGTRIDFKELITNINTVNYEGMLSEKDQFTLRTSRKTIENKENNGNLIKFASSITKSVLYVLSKQFPGNGEGYASIFSMMLRLTGAGQQNQRISNSISSIQEGGIYHANIQKITMMGIMMAYAENIMNDMKTNMKRNEEKNALYIDNEYIDHNNGLRRPGKIQIELLKDVGKIINVITRLHDHLTKITMTVKKQNYKMEFGNYSCILALLNQKYKDIAQEVRDGLKQPTNKKRKKKKN